VAGRHLDRYQQPLTGWWGHAEPFAFERDYRPAPGIRQLLSGTQPVLSLAVAEAGIGIMRRADMRAVREKSMRMTDLLIALVENRCAGGGLELASPRNAASRGSHVSFHHESGFPVMQALTSRGVIGDYRAPGNMRFGVTPMYLRYTDIWDAVEILRDVLETGFWREPEFSIRRPVT
jgi:kynureninase